MAHEAAQQEQGAPTHALTPAPAVVAPGAYRVTFCTSRLGNDLYDALMQIPGVHPWEPFGRRSAWTAPLNAAHVVRGVLDAWACPYTEQHPLNARLPSPPDGWRSVWDAAFSAAVSRGLHPWVGTFVLDFQRMCVAFMHDRLRAHCWAEPGAGKTVIAIVAALATGRPVIVVVLAAALGQTVDEWRRFTGLDPLEYRPPSRRRKSDPALADYLAEHGSRAVVVIGWSMLTEELSELDQIPDPCVVFDESQKAKNPKRARYLATAEGKLTRRDIDCVSTSAAALAAKAHAVFCTTATPAANDVSDLWGQLTLVEPEGWGLTATRFLVRYCGARPNIFGGLELGKPDDDRIRELNERTALTAIRVPYEVSHGALPPKRRMLIRVSQADQIKEQGGHKRAVVQQSKAASEGGRADRAKLAQMRLAQAASRKRARVAEVLASYQTTGKGKVILFTGWRKDAEYSAKALEKQGFDVFMGHGAHSRKERDQIRKDYLSHPGPCALVGTWHAWGTSLNLDDTDVIAFGMLPWTPAETAQAEGRGDRLSMTRPLLYIYFVAENTLDEHVAFALIDKLDAVEAVTPGGRLGAHGGLIATMTRAEDRDQMTADLVAALMDDGAGGAEWEGL